MPLILPTDNMSITPIGPFEDIDTTVPQLRHLQNVPDDPEDFLKWREQVADWRRVVRGMVERDTGFADYQLRLCQESGVYQMIMFGHVWEPRGGGELPFILEPYQIRLWRLLDEIIKTEGRLGDLAVEKSRDLGVTTLCVCWAHTHWLHDDVFSAGLVSRMADLVDIGPNKGTDSMFSKIDFLRNRYPAFLTPVGFDDRTMRQVMLLTHPSKPNTIIGEATTSNTGRSYRNTVRINDEGAFFDDLDEALAAQAQTTQHRITASSASLKKGRAFYDLCRTAETGNGSAWVRLHWSMSPRHTPEKYEIERERMASDPAKFAREVDIDYFADQGVLVYSLAQQKRVGVYPYVEGYQTFCSIDPGQRDPTAVVWFQRTPEGRYRVVRSYKREGMPASFWAAILSGFWTSGSESHDFTDDEYDLMLWTRRLRHVVYVGDPAINNKESATATSFNEQLRRTSAALYRENGLTGQIYVRTTTKNGAAKFPARIPALRELLPRLDFDEAASEVLRALQEYHFPNDDGRAPTREMGIPVHDWSSHYAATCEYFAVNLLEHPGSGSGGGGRGAPAIYDAGGRRIDGGGNRFG